MADLVLDAHILAQKAEEQILNTQNDKKFTIDKNSSVTNVDIISELLKLHKSNDKAIFKPITMDTTETFYNRL